MNLNERISIIEDRLKRIEDYLGMNDNIEVKKSIKDNDIKDEKVGGFTKSQLMLMFQWAKNISMEQLTENDFNELKKWKMLKEFFPNAPENYIEIKTKS